MPALGATIGLPDQGRGRVNAFRRLRGLILPYPELDWNLIEGFAPIGGADCTMSKPNPRRVRPSSLRIATGRPTLKRAVPERLIEARNMKTLSAESDVRQELVRRVRQQILAGTYDTPEKFEAALDRMSNHFDRD